MRILAIAIWLLIATSVVAQNNLTGKQISARNKPGVVLIYSTAKANVVYNGIAPNNEKIQQLSQAVAANINSGQLQADQLIDVYIKTIFSNPQEYFYPTSEVFQKEMSIGAMGTGFILNDNGYVATNCHVIDLVEDEDETKKGFAGQIIVDLAKSFITNLSKSLNAQLTEEEQKYILNGLAGYYVSTGSMQVKKIEKNYGVRFGLDVQGLKVEQVKEASVVTKGNPIPGKDVAILKIDAKDLPTVSLGDEVSTEEGDKVFVMGFPGDATFHPFVAEESVFVPTFTTGIVSAIKKAKTGWNIYQIDAAIDHGNSGGPVFNDKGEVIGLATFGTIDMQNGETKQNYNFFVPISILKEFMNQINIKNETSDIDKLFQAALKDFESQRYKAALTTFTKVEQINGNFPYIKTYISECQTNINKGLDKTPILSAGMWAIIGIVALALIAGTVLFITKRKKGSQNAQVAKLESSNA